MVSSVLVRAASTTAALAMGDLPAGRAGDLGAVGVAGLWEVAGMAPASSDRPAGERPARWTAVAGVALILAVSLATWWLVGPVSLEDTPPRPANLAEHVVGVVACVVGVAAAVALVVAARTGRMDLRWRPTVVALSLAGVPAGWALRFPLEEFGGALFWFGLFGLPLVVYAIVCIPPYNDPPKK